MIDIYVNMILTIRKVCQPNGSSTAVSLDYVDALDGIGNYFW